MSKRDANDSFGEYVAAELKKFSAYDQALLKREISNLIADAEIKKLMGMEVVVVGSTHE